MDLFLEKKVEKHDPGSQHIFKIYSENSAAETARKKKKKKKLQYGQCRKRESKWVHVLKQKQHSSPLVEGVLGWRSVKEAAVRTRGLKAAAVQLETLGLSDLAQG